MSLGVSLPRKYAAHKPGRLAGFIADDTPAGAKPYGADFINSRNVKANSHNGTLSRPAPQVLTLQNNLSLTSLAFDAAQNAEKAWHLSGGVRRHGPSASHVTGGCSTNQAVR
jgi:hypothetical protein